MCLIFRKTVAVLKKYNFKSYHETKHNYFKFDNKMKQLKLKEFQLQLNNLTNNFWFSITATFQYWHGKLFCFLFNCKKIKTFLNGEFVEECLGVVAKNIFYNKSKPFSNLSLSRETGYRRINDIIVKLWRLNSRFQICFFNI